MHKWFFTLLLLVFIGFIGTQVSCRKCTGTCDIIYEVNGAMLRASDTLISLAKSNSMVTIAVESYAERKNGDRDCPSKNQVSCTRDALLYDSTFLYCESDLIINGKVYPKNANLLRFDELSVSNENKVSELPLVVLNTNSDFPPGAYIFRLNGLTTLGKAYRDWIIIEWK